MRPILYFFAFVGLAVVLMGSTYTITNTFTGGTTAVASQVNANFTAAKTAIDDNDARIDALLTTDTCTTPPCDLTSGTTLNGGTIVTQGGALGTPSSGTATNLTGTAASLTAGLATALAANGANCSAGNFPLGVDASGAAESCTDVVLPAEVAAYTTGTSTPVDGSTACNTGDMHLETDAFKIYFCTDGSTDKWYGVALSDTP